MSFKTYPTAHFEDISLKDEAEFIRLFTRMAELGILTPKQFFEALETGKLPDTDSDEYKGEIELYKQQRDEGLYKPLIGGAKDAGDAPTGNSSGRPAGTKAPQKQKKVKPIGASFSMSALRDNVIAADNLNQVVINKLKKSKKLKELDDNQTNFAKIISQAIMLNEPKEEWKNSVDNYFKAVKSPSSEILAEVDTLSFEHDIDLYEATLLYLSKI